ncbi:MAG: PstS family phosphate ABC transporter substrate-binding protein [Pseudomonadota bacterium]
MRSRNAAAAVAAAITLLSSPLAEAQRARDYISIVGSSTVFPFSTVVAERFGRFFGKTPTVESTGSGGGFKLFCSGVGVGFPDVTNSSRRIKLSEVKSCRQAGVRDIVEVKIGYDGIVLANANSAPPVDLTLAEIYLALAKLVPRTPESAELVENPHTRWSDINPAYPDTRIEIMGPPPTSGTRDAFVELAMEGGCQQFSGIKALKKTDPDRFKAVCHAIREDGVFVETGENDNLIVQKLNANPNALGIFGYSFLEQNSDKVQGAAMNGVVPTFDSIAGGEYPVSRPLYFYVKRAHVGVIPGIEGFLKEFTSERAWGEEGYLTDRGLIPMPQSERIEVRDAVRGLALLSLYEY